MGIYYVYCNNSKKQKTYLIIKNILNNTHENIKLGTNIKLGYIPQEIRFDNEELTIYEHMRKIFVGSESELRSKLNQFYFTVDNIDKKVKNLSGGNIQKILLGREIGTDPNVIITAYPVRGLDINSSYMIYDILNEEKKKNTAILFVGEDLDVLLALCDKIMVLCEGKNMGIVHTKETTKEEIGLMMTGSKNLLDLYPEKNYGFASDSLIKGGESNEQN